jgi:hypothetical protein
MFPTVIQLESHNVENPLLVEYQNISMNPVYLGKLDGVEPPTEMNGNSRLPGDEVMQL